MGCTCGAGYTVTEPRNGDGNWDLLYKIAQSLSFLVGGAIPGAGGSGGSGSGGAPTPSFQAGPDITVLVSGVAVNGPNIATPRGVLVVARSLNTGSVYVGGNAVTKDGGGARGAELTQAGMTSVVCPVSNMNQLYINADNAGDRAGVLIL